MKTIEEEIEEAIISQEKFISIANVTQPTIIYAKTLCSNQLRHAHDLGWKTPSEVVEAEKKAREELINWLEAHICQFSERDNIILTMEDWQALKEGRSE